MSIEEIKAREQAATPGPWEDAVTDVWLGDRHIAEVYAGLDADFIAHARTDIPELIAEVEWLTAENATLKAAKDEINRYNIDCTNQCDKLLIENATLKKALEAEKKDCCELCKNIAVGHGVDTFCSHCPKQHGVQQAQQTHETQEAEK
jgi:hypothetical protein